VFTQCVFSALLPVSVFMFTVRPAHGIIESTHGREASQAVHRPIPLFLSVLSHNNHILSSDDIVSNYISMRYVCAHVSCVSHIDLTHSVTAHSTALLRSGDVVSNYVSMCII